MKHEKMIALQGAHDHFYVVSSTSTMVYFKAIETEKDWNNIISFLKTGQY